jgi:opacity protein-like surface antigen
VRDGYSDFEQLVDVPFDRTVPVNIQLKSLQVEAVVEEQPGDLFAVGIRGGLVSNLGPFVAPRVDLEFGVRLPFFRGRLSVLLATGAYGSTDQREASSESFGRFTVDAEVLVWPAELNLLLRLLPGYPFSPYLGAGAGHYLVMQRITPAGLPARDHQDSVFGAQCFAGLEYRLGPGVLLLEGRYLYVHVEAPASEGGFYGQLGGLGLALGYRFLL